MKVNARCKKRPMWPTACRDSARSWCASICPSSIGDSIRCCPSSSSARSTGAGSRRRCCSSGHPASFRPRTIGTCASMPCHSAVLRCLSSRPARPSRCSASSRTPGGAIAPTGGSRAVTRSASSSPSSRHSATAPSTSSRASLATPARRAAAASRSLITWAWASARSSRRRTRSSSRARIRWRARASSLRITWTSPHRGGRAGFVELTGKNSLRAPDYRGNSFHNTLGNLRLNPAAGLLFIDFAAGHLLALEATAELEPIPDERRTVDGPTRALHFFHVQHVRWSPHAAALSWQEAGL